MIVSCYANFYFSRIKEKYNVYHIQPALDVYAMHDRQHQTVPPHHIWL